MSNFLIQHAIANVWCTPDQDKQSIIKPSKLSTARGFRRLIPGMWGSVALPTNDDVYHVYQFGDVSSKHIGIDKNISGWTSSGDIMSLDTTLIEAVFTSGVVYPKSQVFFKRIPNGNLLVALTRDVKLPDLATNQIYFRFYRNAYFDSPREDPNSSSMIVEGVKARYTSDAISLLNNYYNSKANNRHSRLYINGFWHESMVPAELKPGDCIDFIQDDSVVRTVEFKLNTLQTYHSELDGVMKYIIHPLKNDETEIRFLDDTEFFLIWDSVSDNVQSRIGVNINRFIPSTVRQLTHRDYGLNVEIIEMLRQVHHLDIVPGSLSIQVNIRNSGYSRPLVLEANRIHELYKLPNQEIVKCIARTQSATPQWEGSELEQSKYVGIMGKYDGKLPLDAVEEMYGYAGIGVVTADHYQVVNTERGFRSYDVPIGLQNHCTAYEYDKAGILLGTSVLRGHTYILPTSALCTSVELIYGEGTRELSHTRSTDFTLDKSEETYFFRDERTNGLNEEWESLIGKYLVDSYEAKPIWKFDVLQYNLYSRDTSTFLGFTEHVVAVDGVYSVLLNYQDNGGALSPIPVKYGQLDIWLNGKSLIRNIDFVEAFPMVLITNKEYLVEGNTQVIQVRAFGEPTTHLKYIPKNDYGFVKHGMLSINNIFDVRDDMQLRCVVGGKVLARKDLKLMESGGILIDSIHNGMPYHLEYVLQHLSFVTKTSNYLAMDEEKTIRESVSKYLTYQLPEPPNLGPVIIERQHQIYSPYMSTVLHAVLEGTIMIGNDEDRITDNELRDMLSAYDYILELDPCIQPLDRDYVIVHPHQYYHSVLVTRRQYWFLTRVSQLLLGSRVTLSRFLRIGE